MKFSGKFGEYLSLARLLEHEIEAYPAIKVNQESYDLTAISSSGRIIRIQVKTVQLDNKSTNNTVGNLEAEFDFLIIVAVAGKQSADCYVLTRTEAHNLRGRSKQLGVSRKIEGVSGIKSEITPHKEQWGRIRDA